MMKKFKRNAVMWMVAVAMVAMAVPVVGLRVTSAASKSIKTTPLSSTAGVAGPVAPVEASGPGQKHRQESLAGN
ncbi:MAG TPA: hypothetical protein VJX67_15485, partial [Blastocatellia bacterium]|nr:hypothetical protein [Blastocatellia bacterium]